MSACGDFAEHVWKPGSCKNCFYPRSAHRQARPIETTAQNGIILQRNYVDRKKIDAAQNEDDCVITSLTYSKPTIAVKPTRMNSETSDVWTNLNMNIDLQQDSQSPNEKLCHKKMLGLTQVYMDNHHSSKTLKDAVFQNAAGDKCSYSSLCSASTLSPSGLPKEPVFISSIFVTQEDVRAPLTLGENGTSPCESYRPQITKTAMSTYTNSNSRGSLPKKEDRTLPLNSSDSYREALCYGSSGQEQQPTLEIAINILAANPTTAGNSVKSSTSFSSGFPQERGLQNSYGSHGRLSSRVSSMVSESASLSDSCSYRSSTDCLICSEGLDQCRQAGCESFPSLDAQVKERPQNLISSPSPPTKSQPIQLNSEPIYAESTKKKKRSQNENPLQKRSDIEVDLTGDKDCQRAKITVMAAHTEEDNRTFYLSSPDSAVSTQWPHFSPTSTKDPNSPSFKWPSDSSDTASALLQPRLQPSPPIPPKRGSQSPKSFSSTPISDKEASFQAETQSSCSYLQVQSRSTEDTHNLGTSMSATEKRHKFFNTAWNWEGRIEEEEEGGEETMHQCRTHGLINGAAVSEPSDSKPGSPAAHSKEYNQPGRAHNGASHYHPGRASEKDKHNKNMLAKTASFTSDFPAEKNKANEQIPPPPPPKKHHRVSSKMSQSSSDLEKASHGSVESLTQSLKGLGSSFATASSDSLSDSRIFGDVGYQETSNLLSPSHIPSSPLTSSPVSPHSETSNSPGRSLLPPPLPEKKLVNRTVSAPDGSAGKRGNPHLNFSSSEGNVCCQDGTQFSSPSSPVDQRHLYSSNESLERCHPHLSRQLRSRTLDEAVGKNRNRLGPHNRSGVSSSSSPQLSAPSSGSSLHLQTLLSNIDSREGIYSKLGGLYAESLRRLALKCEDHFARSQKNPLRFDESNWSLFKLTCNKPCCDAGDSVYYSASCASDPKNTYAVKICKSQTPDAKQGHLYGLAVQQTLFPHFNLQQDCGHFIACVPQSMLPPDEAAEPAGQVEQERVVVITREVPHQSAADFVREWAVFHNAQPEVYERRVCFLLLQLCNGLEHLKERGVTHRDLCLENLLLVHHSQLRDNKDQKQLPRLLISSFAKAKQRAADDVACDPKFKKDHARLAPEIVSATQYKKFDEFQTGILIYELLHQPNPFEVSPKLKEQEYYCEDLPPIPVLSIYSSGLQQLSRLLLQPDPIKRIHIQEAKRILQCLLWGPRRDLMEQQWERPGELVRHEGLLNWLDVKRALLMMKFAERSLEPEQGTELEDWLCCQYFSSSNPVSLSHTAELLYFSK
ncbi:inactive tyrosine-protein kinase PRAG1 [Lepisosteus oculatus]|uniref:inactive tyrosine-protein kinase PRAG1 n=1 Tax=Lepisosteus oculatus TaxID=7918 RepID=UPI0037217417